jgi:outer membrane receptor protein involved in Fe transport
MPLAPLLAGYAPIQVQAQQSPMGLDEVIVTAQKREQILQDVPISVQALGQTKLENLKIDNFDEFMQFLPSASFVTLRPGFAQVYMRGVASAGDGDANHSGSQPLVGTYLDEQPVTTIQGALDVHLYDIARVESLAGPQGTLYGASSESGTIKIITNQPDPSGFAAGYNVGGNTLSGGDAGYVAEGFLNQPLSDKMAIRIVGWVTRDGGYIDNVSRERTLPSTVIPPREPIITNNASAAEDNYNTADTYGARAALRIDLDDNWTVTPSMMAQKQSADGSFGADNALGDYKVAHAFSDDSDDDWFQSALTVEGKISNYDVVGTVSYLDRDVDGTSDYADYSYWYDVTYLDTADSNGVLCRDGGSACFSDYFYNDAGDAIDFSQYFESEDKYQKYSGELRISTPQDQRLRGIGGVFWQRQEHDIQQDYKINDLSSDLSVTGWSDTLWLTKQERQDDDFALFGQAYYDLTEKLTGTVGMRWFKSQSSLKGFFGFGQGYSSSGTSGEALCDKKFGDGIGDDGGPNTGADLPDFQGAPCKNLDDSTESTDSIFKLNLAYKLTEQHLVYATYSEGFRPGGLNRRGTVPPYEPDQLNNYEVGWKTSWLDDRLRFNGALFHQEWQDFQYSILGPNGLTEITNAADADIDGLEMDVNWAATEGLGVSAGVAWLHSELTQPYCARFGPDGERVNSNPCPYLDDNGDLAFEAPAAAKGTELPVAPQFKANLTSRYQFTVASLDAHFQGALIYVGDRQSDLRKFENDIVGELPAYTLTNFSVGVGSGNWQAELYVNNAFNEYAEYSRYTECGESVCGAQTYSVIAPPRLVGVQFSQEF